MKPESAPLTPSVLRWARERAGYTVEEAAAKLHVKPARVLAWESGAASVTFGRLEDLASLYKRPSALFYLSEPPAEDERRPVDFRANPSGRLVPGLIYQARYARERRGVALELFRELREEVPRFPFACSPDESPAMVGERLRSLLAVSMDMQRSWSKRGGHAALAGWKQAVEGIGVLVFQASKKDFGEARGLSVYADVLPAVVLRSADVPVARVFTLMHELGHIGLREGGVCDLHDADTELFCNKVAAAALIPERELKQQIKSVRGASEEWTDAALSKLARSFSVSEPALVLRLVEVGAASWALYQARRHAFELRARVAEMREDKDAGFSPPHQRSIANNGRTYARLVLESYHRGAIPAARAMRYLGVSFDGLNRIEADLAHTADRAA